MAKKLTLLLMAAVAVLAFAVPAMASAAPTLQTTGGVVLSETAEIKGTGADVILTSSSLGEITCATLTLNGKLSVNNATKGIKGAGPEKGEEPTTTNCKNGTNAVKVTNVTLKNIESTVGGTATVSFTALVDIGASTTCTFTGTNVSGTYTNGGNVLTFASATGITSSPPACGTAKLDGKFTLEQANGEALKAVF